MPAIYGRLSVAGHEFKQFGKPYVPCVCECGTSRNVRRDHLRTGKIKSCGCWHDEAAALNNTTHGHKPRGASTPEYRAWSGMNERCYREGNGRYTDYGGRGICVCDEWRRDFAAFYAYIGPRPAGTSIDRIDVNGNYEPGNVRWANGVTQARNVRNVKLITALGRSMTLIEWAEHSGIKKGTIWYRLRVAGWSPEQAVTP